MTSLSDTCEQVAGQLQHEFGIPPLWPESGRSSDRAEAEARYAAAAAQLARKLDRLVYLNRLHELSTQDRAGVLQQYGEVFGAAGFQHQSDGQIGQFLGRMADLKRSAIAPLLAAAPSVLRSIFQENLALTDAELSVLNNVKKLSSAYNSHPANVRRLVPEYERSVAQIGAVARTQAAIEQRLRHDVAPSAARLRGLAADLQALENTFQNQLGAADDARSRALLRQHHKLEKKARVLSILADLLPQMVLCLPTNWYEDERLSAVISECSDVSETMAAVPRVRSMQDALSLIP